MQLFFFPAGSHYSCGGVRVGSEQQVPEFMCHYASENVRKAAIPGRLQHRGTVVEHIAVATYAFGREEGCTEDFVRQVPRLWNDAQREAGWPLEPAAV